MKTIGGFLKEVRMYLKLTQKQLSAKMGMSTRQISRYENNHTIPTLNILIKFFYYLGIKINASKNNANKI
ncbi:MAG: helix-turn-helix transcriptional regulator [Clostridia bacterium]|jgi:transcriptional regulator with XRE-family HTH domain|nr:helix-turn-helix transcriptional regulator [Clostridia bacterium]